jgi:hypothetical protein
MDKAEFERKDVQLQMRKTFEDFAALKVDLTGKLDGFNLDL